jgi:RNA-directed DNA polymerase
MEGKRQKTRYEQPALWDEAEGEAPTALRQGTEPPAAPHATESPAQTRFLMEVVAGRDNMEKALKRVMANKGSPGADGMRVHELPGHLDENWDEIKEQLLRGTYHPSPVRRVEIPKPNGGKRPLGIPTATDRLIQQAIAQVLTPIFETGFSNASYGFRPGRSAHQATARAQGYIEEGYAWVVDMDIEKFFDNVNHDALMARVARKVADKRVLKTIRAFLNSGVMESGLTSPTDIGTPQGGPLSPLLSNIYLGDLDSELERRGHRFVRYADDCNIYVKSERAGLRVMESLTRFLEKKLKLKVSAAKSAVTRPFRVSFLGFSFTSGKNPKRRISPKAIDRLKKRVRELTSRTRGISLERMIADLNRYLKGWRAYFGFCQTPSVLRDLDSWIRRRLRSFIWKQMKRGRRRFAELKAKGVSKDLAAQTAGSTHGPWRVSRSPGLSYAYPNAYFSVLGLVSLEHG